ncbi:purine catabolism regulator [Thermocatellispora tengchongensis]|uniref:Purine catabolism regulator n=1 Tax=Thermocatellispora tengchongensis TaxID=1073253 RepID=A0A840P780_9ACTN|nr:PucR family transcriptional regulator [Thermocatellispora tengchongensis]MBB5133300.1 purine catabolism regulator [Thermocatellispora tengchongensis]
MAPTLRRVVAIAALHLRVLAGAERMDRPVRWVAVSELEDPTPFLEGGELVLTTGMRLRDDEAAAVPYVARLVGREVTGIGFGVGLGHEEVPATLVRAAADAGLPLVEVPRDTPFVAIGKAVSDLLAAEQYEELTRAFAAQGRLTRAALLPDGIGAVVARLAAEIGGWTVLLDPSGAVLAAAGGGEAHAEALRPELTRLKGGTASMAVSERGVHVILQPLGAARRVRGFFAVGAERSFSPIAHTIVNVACSLLTLALEQRAARPVAERRVRSAVLRLLLDGRLDAARDTLAALGDHLPEGDLSVIVTPAGPEIAGEAGGESFTAALDDRTVLLVPAARTDDVAEALGLHAPVGVSDPATPETLPAALAQADRALTTARRSGTSVMRFADIPGQGLLSLLDPSAADAFATALLAPLHEHGTRTDLLESLHAYLNANGHWDAAAQRLGIHRHTLRYRMRRVTDLLNRDLDDPATRAELLMALLITRAHS